MDDDDDLLLEAFENVENGISLRYMSPIKESVNLIQTTQQPVNERLDIKTTASIIKKKLESHDHTVKNNTNFHSSSFDEYQEKAISSDLDIPLIVTAGPGM